MTNSNLIDFFKKNKGKKCKITTKDPTPQEYEGVIGEVTDEETYPSVKIGNDFHRISDIDNAWLV